MTDEELSPEDAEALETCAKAASYVVDLIPMVSAKFDADVGTVALIACGLLACRLVGDRPDLMSQDELFDHLRMALSSLEHDGVPIHQTEQ